jgi:hypothetical protein
VCFVLYFMKFICQITALRFHNKVDRHLLDDTILPMFTALSQWMSHLWFHYWLRQITKKPELDLTCLESFLLICMTLNHSNSLKNELTRNHSKEYIATWRFYNIYLLGIYHIH